MYAAIAGAVLGATGSIYSGIQSAKEKKKYQAALLDEKKKAQSEADLYKYMSPDQSIAYNKAVNDARESFDDYVKMRDGQDAIMGSDGGSKARIEAGKAMGNTIATVAESEQQRIDNKAAVAKSSLDNLKLEERNFYNQNAAQNAMAGSQSMMAGMNMVSDDMKAHLYNGKGLFESMYNKKK